MIILILGKRCNILAYVDVTYFDKETNSYNRKGTYVNLHIKLRSHSFFHNIVLKKIMKKLLEIANIKVFVKF